MTSPQDLLVLAAFAAKAIKLLVENDGARFFCEFCSPTQPSRVHGEACPVPGVLAVLAERERRRLDGLASLDRWTLPPLFPLHDVSSGGASSSSSD